MQSKDPTIWKDDVLLFLETHFLHWLEAISLMGVLKEAIGILNALQSTIEISLHITRFMQLLILNDLGPGKFQDVRIFT